MIRITAVFISLLISTSISMAFDINDCIINGMKGVSSDAAARQIRYACDQKLKAFEQKTTEQNAKEFAKEYGEVLDSDSLEEKGGRAADKPGFQSVMFVNKNSGKTITYLRLAIAPDLQKGMGCDYRSYRYVAYKLLLRPNAGMRLIVPVTTEFNCISVDQSYGREPSYKDLIGFIVSGKPESVDPLGVRN